MIMPTINMTINDTLVVMPMYETVCIYPQYTLWIIVNFIWSFFIVLNKNFYISEKMIKIFKIKSWKTQEFLIMRNFNMNLAGDLFVINLMMFTIYMVYLMVGTGV